MGKNSIDVLKSLFPSPEKCCKCCNMMEQMCVFGCELTKTLFYIAERTWLRSNLLISPEALTT